MDNKIIDNQSQGINNKIIADESNNTDNQLISNDSKYKGKSLHRKVLFFKVAYVIFVGIFVASIVIEDQYKFENMEQILPKVKLFSGILVVIFTIISTIYYSLAKKYCPYCYKKGFTTSTIYTNILDTYYENEDSDNGGRKRRYKYTKWEGLYKNNCCGKEYTKTWVEKKRVM